MLFTLGGDIIDEIARGINAFLSDAVEWGKDLIDNFLDGIEDMKYKIQRVGQDIKNWLGIDFDVFTNDKKAIGWGQDMVKHFISGMQSQTTNNSTSYSQNMTSNVTVNTSAGSGTSDAWGIATLASDTVSAQLSNIKSLGANYY